MSCIHLGQSHQFNSLVVHCIFEYHLGVLSTDGISQMRHKPSLVCVCVWRYFIFVNFKDLSVPTHDRLSELNWNTVKFHSVRMLHSRSPKRYKAWPFFLDIQRDCSQKLVCDEMSLNWYYLIPSIFVADARRDAWDDLSLSFNPPALSIPSHRSANVSPFFFFLPSQYQNQIKLDAFHFSLVRLCDAKSIYSKRKKNYFAPL